MTIGIGFNRQSWGRIRDPRSERKVGGTRPGSRTLPVCHPRQFYLASFEIKVSISNEAQHIAASSFPMPRQAALMILKFFA